MKAGDESRELAAAVAAAAALSLCVFTNFNANMEDLPNACTNISPSGLSLGAKERDGCYGYRFPERLCLLARTSANFKITLIV